MKTISIMRWIPTTTMGICLAFLALPLPAEPNRVDSRRVAEPSQSIPLPSKSSLDSEEFVAGVADVIEARIPGKGLGWFQFHRVATGSKNGALVVLYTCQIEERTHRIANYYQVVDGKAAFFRTTGVDLTRQQIAEPSDTIDSSVGVPGTDSDRGERTLVPSSNECPSEC